MGMEYNNIDNNNYYNNTKINNANITEVGKKITYKTCDGKEVATMEEVMEYNQAYYDRMMIQKDNLIVENKGMHR